MSGNLNEFVEDCYHNNYEGAPADGSAWITGEDEYRVVRGGGITSTAQNMRASYRGDSNFLRSNPYDTGFRCARAVTGETQ